MALADIIREQLHNALAQVQEELLSEVPKGSIIADEDAASSEDVQEPESSEASVKDEEPSYNYDISPEYHQRSTNN